MKKVRTMTDLWTDEQVEKLNEYQTKGHMHPFTCGNDHDGERVLVATRQGWVCPSCSYTQDWAHEFMFEGAVEFVFPNPETP